MPPLWEGPPARGHLQPPLWVRKAGNVNFVPASLVRYIRHPARVGLGREAGLPFRERPVYIGLGLRSLGEMSIGCHWRNPEVAPCLPNLGALVEKVSPVT